MAHKILMVEDDFALAMGTEYALTSEGYAVTTAGNLAQAREKFDDSIDLVLLDVMLPGVDGIELLRRMKANEHLHGIPVVMATAKGAEYDRISGLDSGADDYLVKPFSVMELASRVRAVLRRCKPPAEKRLTCGGLTLNEQEHTVAVNGQRVELTYKEYELLRLFLTHPRTAFTRDKLMEQVWGTDFCGESRTVDMHIRTLRGKLGPYGDRIETVRGVGYRLEGKT